MRRMRRPEEQSKQPMEDIRTEKQLEADGELQPFKSAAGPTGTGEAISNAPASSPMNVSNTLKGETVTVTWGEEVFAPVQYNTCRVGPFAMTTTVRMGETPQQALYRAYEDLEAYVKRVRSLKVKAFKEELVALGIIRA